MAARDERVKLTANALNTLSVAVAAAGLIKPVVEAGRGRAEFKREEVANRSAVAKT